MKNLKVSILALSVLVGGAVFASAASSAVILSTSDVVLDDVCRLIVGYVGNLFSTSVLFTVCTDFDTNATIVTTDAGGKISVLLIKRL